VIHLLGAARGHGVIRFGAREKPGPWALDLPIGPQVEQETLGEQAVAVLMAFTLVDANAHAAGITLHIGEMEPHDFAAAQASGIRHHQ
jgi:hypothetical protein